MMRAISAACVAAAFAASLSAQTPAPSQPAQDAKDTAKTVTVTGCLKAGETAESFLLSDLKWSQDKAVGTSGTVTPATPPVTATSLKLMGSPSAKLSEHIGHTIEVSGTISDKPTSSADPARPADPAARPSSASAAQPSLNVKNVRMIAATCQGQ
jgi:hypothetical protein